jgi:hypothetical protein
VLELFINGRKVKRISGGALHFAWTPKRAGNDTIKGEEFVSGRMESKKTIVLHVRRR